MDGNGRTAADVRRSSSVHRRFVTEGQGEECGRVWNFKPVVEEKEEFNRDVPKFLTQMDPLLGCVNCVRSSGSGFYLASGGDDKLVLQVLGQSVRQ